MNFCRFCLPFTDQDLCIHIGVDYGLINAAKGIVTLGNVLFGRFPDKLRNDVELGGFFGQEGLSADDSLQYV